MTQTSNSGTWIAVLPCNGLSARGHVTTLAIDQVTQGLEDVRCVNIVPLMARIPEELADAQGARAVIGLAGCNHRCEASACRQALGRDLDDAFVVGDLLRQEVTERSEVSDEELRQCALEVSSRLVGILGKY